MLGIRRNRLVKMALASAVAVGLVAGGLIGCGKQPAAEQPKGGQAGTVVKLNYYFPVDAAGPLAKLMTEMVNDFNKSRGDIQVTPVYAGSYEETQAKAVAASKSGSPPDVAVLLSTALYQLKDLGVIEPLNQFVDRDKDGKDYLNDFFPALFMNARDGDTLWAVPFQRSTPVLYYNKDAFTKAGLDPSKPPKSWNELAEDAKRLTVRDPSGNTTQWGVEIPTYYWILQGFVIENGGQLMNDDGSKALFNSPATIAALKFWVDLQKQDKVMPSAAMPWKTVATDFTSGRTAMIFHSTGSLVGFRTGAKFPVGVAFMPAKQDFGVPTGGGNLYVFKGLADDRKQAAWTFVRWMTAPEQAARWSIGSGYIAVRQSAWDLPVMKEYTAKYPEALVGRDQLKYAKKEFATHELTRLWKIMDDSFAAVMTGSKTPEAGMQEAQKQADEVLKPFQK